MSEKIPKKIAKKFKKLKNIILSIFLSKPGDEICREREKKKILLPNSVPTGPGLENSQKKKKNSRNYKTSFWHYFYPIREEIGREREKKILLPNSVPTRPGLENSQKNSKDIQEIKKHHSGNISIQIEMR